MPSPITPDTATPDVGAQAPFLLSVVLPAYNVAAEHGAAAEDRASGASYTSSGSVGGGVKLASAASDEKSTSTSYKRLTNAELEALAGGNKEVLAYLTEAASKDHGPTDSWAGVLGRDRGNGDFLE